MKLFRSAVLVIVVVSMLSGCGGSGGVGSTVALTDTVRTMQPGDKWTYDITGTWTDGATQHTVQGTCSKEMTTRTVTTPQNVTARFDP